MFLSMHVGFRVFLQDQLGRFLEGFGHRAQPRQPPPDGTVAETTLWTTVRSVAERDPAFLDGRSVGGQVVLKIPAGFAEDILFDESLVAQGEGRIFGKDPLAVATAEPHAPRVHDLDHDFVEGFVVDADAEFP